MVTHYDLVTSEGQHGCRRLCLEGNDRPDVIELCSQIVDHLLGSSAGSAWTMNNEVELSVRHLVAGFHQSMHIAGLDQKVGVRLAHTLKPRAAVNNDRSPCYLVKSTDVLASKGIEVRPWRSTLQIMRIDLFEKLAPTWHALISPICSCRERIHLS